MVTKYNLSVPDELDEKIRARRDYLGNLSKLFQEAVSEKIRQKEEFEERLKGGENMGAMIERLKREKMDDEADYRALGKEAGLTWAKAARFKDLKYAATLWQGTDGATVDECYVPKKVLRDPVIGHYFRTVLSEDPRIEIENERDDCVNDFTEQWLSGWQEAVCEFWETVAVKL